MPFRERRRKQPDSGCLSFSPAQIIGEHDSDHVLEPRAARRVRQDLAQGVKARSWFNGSSMDTPEP